MFKKIELWIVYILILIFIVATILFGSILRHHYIGGKKFSSLQKIAIYIAEIPHNIKRISSKNYDQLLNNSLSHKKKFTRFLKTKRNEILVLSRFNPKANVSVVELIDLNTFKVIHHYKLDIDEVNKNIDTKKKENKFLFRDHNSQRFRYMHPYIDNDGNLISHSEYAYLFKIGFCSDFIWFNDDELFHHSIEVDHQNNYWVPSLMYPYSKYVQQFKTLYGFKEDAITKINSDGKIIYQKSVLEIMKKAKLIDDLHENWNHPNLLNDPIHINDIQPALSTTDYWMIGDLFISLRNFSAIIHYRPDEDMVINYIEGNFNFQHDVDIFSDSKIVLLNNNSLQYPLIDNVPRLTEIIIYDFQKKSFERILNKELIKEEVSTEFEGLLEFLDDGSIMIEEQGKGRILFYDKTGNLEWEYINKKDGKIYNLSWSRIIKDTKKIDKIRNLINKNKC